MDGFNIQKKWRENNKSFPTNIRLRLTFDVLALLAQQACRRAGLQAGRRAGVQACMQAGRQAGTTVTQAIPSYFTIIKITVE
jgi:hypothetical protein